MRVTISALASTVLVIACGKSAAPPDDAFTLTSRVEVIETQSCKNDSSTSLALTKIDKNYLAKVIVFLPCEIEKPHPYLTLAKEKKATLVFNEANKSGCECARVVSVKISDRIDEGDTLYVTSNGEVIGHATVPK